MKLEDGEYGRRAVITSTWRSDMARYLLANEVLGLELNYAKGWRLKERDKKERISPKNGRKVDRDIFGNFYDKCLRGHLVFKEWPPDRGDN